MDAQTGNREISPSKAQMTVEELGENLRNLWESIYNQSKNALGDKESTLKQQQVLIHNFIEGQIKEKDQYEHVFKTDQGSVYFTLATGESLRFKHSEQGWEKELQPISQKIIYVPPEQVDQLFSEMEQKKWDFKIVGIPLQTAPLGLGVRPIEVGNHDHPKISFSEQDNTMTILGDEHKSVYDLHFGHAVTEIIK